MMLSKKEKLVNGSFKWWFYFGWSCIQRMKNYFSKTSKLQMLVDLSLDLHNTKLWDQHGTKDLTSQAFYNGLIFEIAY